MKTWVSDVLVCPRCGPPFRLVLVAHDVSDRVIRSGELGCSNCRDCFSVGLDGVDLRPPPRPAWREDGGRAAYGDPDVQEISDRDAESPWMWMAAALGLDSGGGLVVMPGHLWSMACQLARATEDLEVLVVGRQAMGRIASGVTGVLTGATLPLLDGVARGAVGRGSDSAKWWSELFRVVAPGGRLVIVDVTGDARDWIRQTDITVMVDQSDVVVGAVSTGRSGRGMAHWMDA